jgi:hypothetical protein
MPNSLLLLLAILEATDSHDQGFLFKKNTKKMDQINQGPSMTPDPI